MRTVEHRLGSGLVGLLVLCAAPAVFEAQSAAPTARSGFAADRLTRIDRFLQEAVDSSRIGGAVALVLRDGHPVYSKAFGWADKEAGRRMSTDAIFRIASKTKALTSVAVMMLLEEGKLALEDAVSRWLPSFAKTTVAVSADSVVPSKRQITIKDLLTHSAGISYGTNRMVAAKYQAKGFGPAAGYGWYLADKDETDCDSMDRLATLPFMAQPGEAFVYGYNSDVLGCVVERVSGMPLDEFLRTRITQPLGMRDTWFFLPTALRARLTAVYASDSTGHTVRAPDGPRGQGNYVDGPRRDFSGGAGLLSTAGDYARFLEMLRNHGALAGVRLLSPHSVDLMTTNQVGTLYNASGQGFGLGFYTIDRYGAYGLRSVGSFGWGSAYAGIYWVDPKERLTAVFMIQQIPDQSGVPMKFADLVYQALLN